jgi:hypothetical protein
VTASLKQHSKFADRMTLGSVADQRRFAYCSSGAPHEL